MSLSPDEFLRRFLLHVPPQGFHRIRHCSLLANGHRAIDLDHLRALIAEQNDAAAPKPELAEAEPETTTLPACPCCGGRMRVIEIFGRGDTPRTAAGSLSS